MPSPNGLGAVADSLTRQDDCQQCIVGAPQRNEASSLVPSELNLEQSKHGSPMTPGIPDRISTGTRCCTGPQEALVERNLTNVEGKSMMDGTSRAPSKARESCTPDQGATRTVTVRSDAGQHHEGAELEDCNAGCFPDCSLLEETWILCEKCLRWRRIKQQFIPEGPWHCWMNPDKR